MKKIFLFLVAVSLVSFASAAPVVKTHAKNFNRTAKHATVVKHAVAADPIALNELDAIEFNFYASYSTETEFDYSLIIFNNNEEAEFLPQIELDIQTAVKDEFVGEYSPAKNNLVLDYSALYLVADNEDGYETLDLTDASCTVELKDGKYTVKGTATIEGGQVYTFEVTAEAAINDAEHPYEPQEPQTLDMNILSGEVDAEYASYGIIDVVFTTSEADIILEYITSDTKATTVPAGTYKISDDEDATNTFIVGYFMSMYGVAAGSYVATDDAYFYLAEGTVKVEKVEKGTKVSCDAKSYYGTPVKFEYTIEATAIDNVTVDTKATKVIRDGQVYIIRDGKTFNVLGAEL